MSSTKKTFYLQREPLEFAIAELSKSLDDLSAISKDKRKDLLLGMRDYPYLTNLNMKVMASALAFMELVDDAIDFPPGADEHKIPRFFNVNIQNVESMGPIVTENIPPKNKDVIFPINYTKQNLYDYINKPLFEPINDKDIQMSETQTKNFFLKMRATLIRYIVSLSSNS